MSQHSGVLMNAIRRAIREDIASSPRGAGKSTKQIQDMAAKQALDIAGGLTLAQLRNLVEDRINGQGDRIGQQLNSASAISNRNFDELRALAAPSARSAAADSFFGSNKKLIRAEESRQLAALLKANSSRASAARGVSQAAARRRHADGSLFRGLNIPRSLARTMPAKKTHVTPSGRRISMAAHRKKAAAARKGAATRKRRMGSGLARSRGNVRRGGAFLGSPAALIKEAVANAAKSAIKNYVKPAARKLVKSGVKAGRAGAHRGVNALSSSAEKALLGLIGNGFRLPGGRSRRGGAYARVGLAPRSKMVVRRRVGGTVRGPARIPRRSPAGQFRSGGAVRLAVKGRGRR